MPACEQPYLQGDLPALRKCSDLALSQGQQAEAYQAMIWRSELLLKPRDKHLPSRIELDEAAFAAKRAKKLKPQMAEPQGLLCRVAEQQHNTEQLATCADELAQLAPTKPDAYRFKTLVALAQDRLPEAQDALDLATERGLEAAEARSLQAQIDAQSPLWADRRVHWLAGILGAMVLLWLFRRRILGRI